MPSHTVPLTATQSAPAVQHEATSSPSSASMHAMPPTQPSPSKEVTTVVQRIRHILRLSVDTTRIDAHRDAVQRELGLSRPIL